MRECCDAIVYFPVGLVGGMPLPELEVALELEVPVESGMVAPELPGVPVPLPLDVPLPPLVPLVPLLSEPLALLPPLALPEAPAPPPEPEVSGERPDIKLQPARARTHAVTAICLYIEVLLKNETVANSGADKKGSCLCPGKDLGGRFKRSLVPKNL